MKLPHRRHFLHLGAGAAALPAVSRIAWAQAYPSHPVHIIVSLAPGGGADIVARLIGQRLSERLGQPFIIENRTGGAGNIATEAVVRAPPDGYTLLFITPANVISTTLYDKLSFDFLHDILPVARISRDSLFMVVNPSFPAKTVPEFIAYAKANPGKINMASAGNGSPQHVAGELFKMMANVEMTHVPYRGQTPALTDLLAGQVQVMFAATPSVTEYIRTARLRALAVTTATRSEALPDVPTVGEFVPGYEASGFFGVGAPKDTPDQTVDKLNKEINAALADPTIKARLVDLGSTVVTGSPAEFGKFIAEDTEKWAKVIRAANIKPE
jgi:tripartite-type tricarboxylate transporter receptor subunit TctC